MARRCGTRGTSGRYSNTAPATEQEVAKGEKRKKIGVPIWCEGKVMAIANGTTDKAAPQSKNVLAKALGCSAHPLA